MGGIQKIKTCPFCQQKARAWQVPRNDEEEMKLHPEWTWNFPGMWVIGCETQGCLGNINHFTSVFVSRGNAIRKWNCRSLEELNEYERG